MGIKEQNGSLLREQTHGVCSRQIWKGRAHTLMKQVMDAIHAQVQQRGIPQMLSHDNSCWHAISLVGDLQML